MSLLNMLESPLNLAHREQRKTESRIKSGKYEEAIKHLNLAEEWFTKALASTNSGIARESLQLQKEYLLHQHSVIRHKQKAAENLKEQIKVALVRKQQEVLHQKPETLINHEIRHQILTIEEEHCDTLVVSDENLVYHDSSIPNESFQFLPHPSEYIEKTGIKLSKNNNTREEELQIINTELRKTISTLNDELEKSKADNRMLRASLKELQKIHLKCQKSVVNLPANSNNLSSSMMASSGIQDKTDVFDIPALDPIEIPKFYS